MHGKNRFNPYAKRPIKICFMFSSESSRKATVAPGEKSAMVGRRLPARNEVFSSANGQTALLQQTVNHSV